MDHALPVIRLLIAALLLSVGLPAFAQKDDAQDYGRFAEAKRLLDGRDYAGAVRAIDEEISRRPLAREEGFIYVMLAIAAWKSNQAGKAYDATIRGIRDQPSAQLPWQLLRHLRPTPQSWEAMQLPEGLQQETKLLPVLRCDHYAEWPPFATRGCAAAYASYAEQLVAAGSPELAKTMRETAMASLVAHASHAYIARHDVEEADSLITASVEIGDLSEAQPEVKAVAYLLLTTIDRQKLRFLHAIDDYERVAALTNGKLEPEMRDELQRLLQDVFESISWEPATHMLRAQDPDDFFDNMDIDGPPLPKGRSGKRIPYGMTSPDEDHATLASASIGIRLLAMLHKPYESIDSIVEKRLAKQNFELPVKLLVNSVWISAMSDDPLDTATISRLDTEFRRVESAMTEAEDIPDATLVAFQVAKRAFKILTKR